MASVNLLKNNIGVVEQAQALVKIKEAKPTLKTLCGLTMKEAELDLSGQGLQAADAVLLASDINANGALARVDLSGNNLVQESSYIKKSECSGPSFNVGDIVVYKGEECSVSKGVDSDGELKVLFTAAFAVLAASFKSMPSLTDLGLANNNLGVGGANILAPALQVLSLHCLKYQTDCLAIMPTRTMGHWHHSRYPEIA